jgi:hypothetical protein
MNFTQQAIYKAMNAGWNQINALGVFKGVDAMVLDPLFWQSLGEEQGWAENRDCKHLGMVNAEYRNCRNCEYWAGRPVWEYQWHRFIDHLAEGGNAETFFMEILG